MEHDVLELPAGGQAEEWPEEKKESALRVLLRQRELIASLTLRDIRSRYKQSVLGIAWALLTPIAMTLVYTLVFARIAGIPTDGQPPGLFYYIVMVPWTFFQQGVTAGSECLVGNFNLITKIYFPREVFPISAILGKTVDLGLGALVLVPLFFIYHIPVTWLVLWVIPVLLIETCFMLGLSFILSSVNLFYRDVRHVVPLLTHVWMYLTPIIYSLTRVPKKYVPFYMTANPMSPVMDTFRKVTLMGQEPIYVYLWISAAISLVVLFFGYWLFKKLEPAFAELI